MRHAVLSSVLLALALACGGAGAPPSEAPRPAPVEPAPAPAITQKPPPTSAGPMPALQPGAPVEGIHYWAEPGELEDFLAYRGPDRPTKTVEVADVKGLLAALADDTLILLAPGRYTLLDADPLDNLTDEADWDGLSEHYDGGRIHGLKNVVIAAATQEPTVILQPHSYASVLWFDDVEEVGLFGLTLGHRPDLGSCQGDVLRITHSQDLAVAHTTLFGSGTQGVVTVDVDGFRLWSSVITDSSEQFASFGRSRRVQLSGVDIKGNTGQLLRGFTIHRSEVHLNNVSISNNHELSHTQAPKSYGQLFSVDGSYGVAEFYQIGSPWRTDFPEQSSLELEFVDFDSRSIEWPPAPEGGWQLERNGWFRKRMKSDPTSATGSCRTAPGQSVASLIRHLDEVDVFTVESCRPCEGRSVQGAPFLGGAPIACDHQPKAAGQCTLFWGEGHLDQTRMSWYIRENRTPILESCSRIKT